MIGVWPVERIRLARDSREQAATGSGDSRKDLSIYQLVYPLEYLFAGEFGTFKNKTP